MKLICIGRNYTEHIQELDNPIPEDLIFFLKPKTALIPTNTIEYWPDFLGKIAYETELVFEVSKTGKNISLDDAFDYFERITLGIDFTARNIQKQLQNKGLPWEKSKSFDHSALIGKWIDKKTLSYPIYFYLLKNNQKAQFGNNSQMIYSIEQIISEISKYYTLEKGDLIFTGTPAGVGFVEKNDFLQGFIENTLIFELKIT